MELQRIMHWLLPSAMVVGGFLIGFTFEKIIIKKLKSAALRTKWKGDEIIISAIRGVTALWFVMAGIYGALYYISLSPALVGLIQKILLVLLIFSATLVLARISAGFLDSYASRVKGVLVSTSIFLNLTKLLVFLIGEIQPSRLSRKI